MDLEEWLKLQPISILQLEPSDRIVLKVAGKHTNFNIMVIQIRNYIRNKKKQLEHYCNIQKLQT